MKVLVTGGNGFVGAAVIKKLLAENYEVSVLVNQNSTLEAEAEIEKHCRVFRADIRDYESLNDLKITGNFDAVVHSAGLAHQFGERSEQDFWDVNVSGTKNVAELAFKFSAGHFVLLSSVAVYGKSSESERTASREGLQETQVCRPEGIYAVTKYESEKAAQEICGRNRMTLTILRLTTVIGENDRGNVFRLIKAIDRRRFIWIGDGRNLKSLIYKGDAARACLEVLKKPDKPGIYNLAAEASTMKEIVEEIYRRLGRRNSRFSISAEFLHRLFRLNEKTLKIERLCKISETIRKWLSDDVFSGKKFKDEFNFQTETTVAEAIGREVESYRQSK